jgi:hypothetical protein
MLCQIAAQWQQLDDTLVEIPILINPKDDSAHKGIN